MSAPPQPAPEITDTPRRRLTRRQLLLRALGGTAVLGAAGVGWGVFGERHHPQVVRVTVPLPTLPRALHGFTLCHISDLHRGPYVTEEYLADAIATANALRADLIAVTGDYVSHSWKNAYSCGKVLARLTSPYGVWAVPGNHDTRAGSSRRVCRIISEAGVPMLINRAERLPIAGAEAWICGVDDALRASPDLDAALAPVPEGGFPILLCHEPDYADVAARRGIPLQLSGHSHGGQVSIPGLPPLILPRMCRRYPRGLQKVKGTESYVYTNVGLGVADLPIRLNCPPEITLITLTRR